jgi:hypothetical protein
MKKIILIALVSVFCTSVYSQKKKTQKKASSTTALAKSDNATAEILKNNFCLSINSKTTKDTIVIKSIDPLNLPTGVKISNYTTKGFPLCLVTWIEKNVTTTKLKTTSATKTYSEIFDLATKTKVFSNSQTLTNIKEIHFLDTKQTVSETIERNQNEGFVFMLKPTGDISLKTKTQENKMGFDLNTKKYVASRK